MALTGLLVLLAIYLSLIPFAFTWVPWSEATTRFHLALVLPFLRPRRADFVANATFFAFVGLALSGALALDRRRLAQAVVALATSALVACLTLTLEFAQVFFPGRVVSRADVLAGALGGAVGALGWALVGQSLVNWFRESAARGDQTDWLLRLLTLYAVGFVLAGLAPFDPTFDPGLLAAKYRARMIVLVPLRGSLPHAEMAWRAAWTFVTTAPLGIVTLLGWSRHDSRRPVLAAVLTGGGCVAALECAQVLIPSRVADANDVLFGLFGVAVGVFVAWRWTRAREGAVAASSGSASASRLALATAIALWSLATIAYHWYPFRFTADPQVLEERLRGLSLMPLGGYYRSTPFVALDQFITKLAMGLPLGVMADRWLGPGRSAGRRRLTVAGTGVAGLLFFGAIEVGQVFLPDRVPDTGDVLVGVCGVLLGLLLSSRLAGDEPGSDVR